jgi:hypothetical protein
METTILVHGSLHTIITYGFMMEFQLGAICSMKGWLVIPRSFHFVMGKRQHLHCIIWQSEFVHPRQIFMAFVQISRVPKISQIHTRWSSKYWGCVWGYTRWTRPKFFTLMLQWFSLDHMTYLMPGESCDIPLDESEWKTLHKELQILFQKFVGCSAQHWMQAHFFLDIVF